MLKRLLDPNRTVDIVIRPVRSGWFVWVARDADTGAHVATGTMHRTAAEAQAHAEAYMKVKGE